jgi:hypothetical protein
MYLSANPASLNTICPPLLTTNFSSKLNIGAYFGANRMGSEGSIVMFAGSGELNVHTIGVRLLILVMRAISSHCKQIDSDGNDPMVVSRKYILSAKVYVSRVEETKGE